MTENALLKDGHLHDFRPAKANPNSHTQRGLDMLANAVSEDGWVAPLTVAADGESLDGAARLEVAADKFGDDVLVIEHDGARPVVMVRTDIPNAETEVAKRIIYRANRIAEVDLSWDGQQIAADLEAGLDLEPLFKGDEIAAILEEAADGMMGEDLPEFPEYDESIADTVEYITCEKCGHRWPK